jgi:hypothetical protein
MMTGKALATPPWARASDQELLALRFADLELVAPGPFLEGCIAKVFGELEARGLRLKPSVWLSDEWFSPDGIAGIAVPFYLSHPRLIRLERRMMHRAEGAARAECLRLIRHEVGHAVQHAYHLERQRGWRTVFGRSSTPYPTRYRPDPSSWDYVHHLGDWYAQCHPDEDFAETFAVWLRPRSGWRHRYAGWPALGKLLYVEDLMRELAAMPVPRARRRQIDPVGRLTRTLGDHYRERRRRFRLHRPSQLDGPLRQVLGDGPARRRGTTVLRAVRRDVEAAVDPTTPVASYAFAMTYDDLVSRASVLDVRTSRSAASTVTDLARFLRRHVRALLRDPSTREWIPL